MCPATTAHRRGCTVSSPETSAGKTKNKLVLYMQEGHNSKRVNLKGKLDNEMAIFIRFALIKW